MNIKAGDEYIAAYREECRRIEAELRPHRWVANGLMWLSGAGLVASFMWRLFA